MFVHWGAYFHLEIYGGGEWRRKNIKMYSSASWEMSKRRGEKDHACVETPDTFSNVSNDLEIQEN